MQHTHTPKRHKEKAKRQRQRHRGWKQMATCTQLWEVEVTPPMNSVGFLADSNKLKISEPSMSFSPEDCLVWVNREMESQAQRSGHRRAGTHSQLVRQNCRRGTQGEGWRDLQTDLETHRDGKSTANRGEQGLWFGKAERVPEVRAVLGEADPFTRHRHLKPRQHHPTSGTRAGNKTAGISMLTSDRGSDSTMKTTKKLGLAALNISQTAREMERLGVEGLPWQTSCWNRKRRPKGSTGYHDLGRGRLCDNVLGGGDGDGRFLGVSPLGQALPAGTEGPHLQGLGLGLGLRSAQPLALQTGIPPGHVAFLKSITLGALQPGLGFPDGGQRLRRPPLWSVDLRPPPGPVLGEDSQDLKLCQDTGGLHGLGQPWLKRGGGHHPLPFFDFSCHSDNFSRHGIVGLSECVYFLLVLFLQVHFSGQVFKALHFSGARS